MSYLQPDGSGNVYIDNNDPETALYDFIGKLDIAGVPETVGLSEVLGRTTYEPHFAKVCDPLYNAAAMDGIMTRSASTFAASETTPVTLRLHRDFEYVNTGAQISADCDTVIMIEDVIKTGDETVNIIQSAYPWQHVRFVGESVVAGEMILPSGHKIRPADMGALAAGGFDTVTVFRRPTVGIIPTGAELVESPEMLRPGRIMESNSHVFAALTVECGGLPHRYPIVRDDFDELLVSIRSAVADNDIVVINAGTSAGTKDHTLAALNTLGTVHTHGLAVKPGKPTILGHDDPSKTLLVGLPGHPVSAMMVFALTVGWLLRQVTGTPLPPAIPAKLTCNLASSPGKLTCWPCSLRGEDGEYRATPVFGKSGLITTLTQADGYFSAPREAEGLQAGQMVMVQLFY